MNRSQSIGESRVGAAVRVAAAAAVKTVEHRLLATRGRTEKRSATLCAVSTAAASGGAVKHAVETDETRGIGAVSAFSARGATYGKAVYYFLFAARRHAVDGAPAAGTATGGRAIQRPVQRHQSRRRTKSIRNARIYPLRTRHRFRRGDRRLRSAASWKQCSGRAEA